MEPMTQKLSQKQKNNVHLSHTSMNIFKENKMNNLQETVAQKRVLSC